MSVYCQRLIHWSWRRTPAQGQLRRGSATCPGVLPSVALAALSGQLELGGVDGMGGDGGGGGVGSGVGSSDRARARCYLETLRTRARVAVQARLLGVRLRSRTSRRRSREIGRRWSEMGRRSSRDRSSLRRRARGGGCWTTRSAACSRPGVRPCCCTPAAAPHPVHLTPCTSPRAHYTPCTSPGARRFGSGLLELQELCWESTPAPLLERVVAYERVHAMPGARA